MGECVCYLYSFRIHLFPVQWNGPCVNQLIYMQHLLCSCDRVLSVRQPVAGDLCVSAMVGHYVYAAYAPCITMEGYFVDVGIRSDYGDQGTVLIVSTPSHNLRDYGVYAADGFWFGDVVPWRYQGTVAHIWNHTPTRPSRFHMILLLGPCTEIYAFAN